MRFFKKLIFPVVLMAPLLALGACSVNPATGKQSFTAFMSPEKEKEVGASEHPKILEQFSGVYDDADLGFYVARIGANLAKHAELPDLNYTFTVLNDENVNAFALPGGYVYITRGLLAIAANEAEMAGVLAHEIGHITARHTAQRYSATMATNIGLQVLSVLGSVAGAPTGSGQLAAFGAQAALQSYSREQELEADMLGVRYLSRSGYDPNAMTSFFHKLKAHSELQAAMLGEKKNEESLDIMSTHPLTSERIVEAEKLAAVTEAHGHEIAKELYDKKIDGLLFGDDPEQGIRRGRVFEHPGLGFRFEVPPGFTMVNTPQRVIAKDADGSVIVFDNSDAKKVKEVGGIEKYIRAINFKGSKFTNIENLNVNGMPAVTGVVRLSMARTVRDVRLLVIQESPDNVYRFWFDTEPEKTEAMALEFRRTTHSFKRLTPAEIAAIKPLRIRFTTVHQGDTVEVFGKRMPMENFGLEWFELLNDLDKGKPLTPGSKVRIVSG